MTGCGGDDMTSLQNCQLGGIQTRCCSTEADHASNRPPERHSSSVNVSSMFFFVPKIFALLPCIKHLLPRQSLLELGGGRSNLAVNIGIILSLDCSQRLSGQSVLEIVNYPRNCFRYQYCEP